MRHDPYSRFDSKNLILRDLLAADRTVLANERTFLAFVRTALTLLVAGVSFIKFFQEPIIVVLGWIFVPLAVVVQVIGTRSYIGTRRTLVKLEADEEESPPLSGSSHDV